MIQFLNPHEPPEPSPMRPDSIPSELPNADTSRIVHAGDCRFHVQVAGRGPVVLLLHGTAAATHSWQHVLPALATQCTVIVPDLPGHGFTDAPASALSLPGMARALRALLDALTLEPIVVAGHSAGVAIAVRMALDGMLPATRELVGLGASLVPPSATYLTVAAPLVQPFVTSPLVARIATAIAALPGVPATVLAATGSTLTPASLHWYERFMRSESHVQAAFTMMARWELPTLLRDAPSLDIPLALLHGSKDGYIPLSALRTAAAQIPTATLEVVAGAGHLLHEELPARAVTAVRDAVARAQRSGMSPREHTS